MKSQSNSQELDKLLDDFRLQHDVTCSDDVAEQTEITKTALLQLALSCLPDKANPEKYTGVFRDEAKLWNSAIDTIEQQIKLKFGGKNG